MTDTCRICFGTDAQETMISPCNCRGSSAYIHQDCYERYLEHFPDGLCRVCMSEMQMPDIVHPPGLAIGSLVLAAIILNNATVSNTVRLALLVGFGGVIHVLNSRGLLTKRFVTIAAGLTMLLLSAQNNMQALIAINMTLLLFGTVMTLGVYVGLEGILACAVATVCYLYTSFLALRLLLDIDDVWTNIAFMNIVFMTWYGWYMMRQPLMPPVHH